MFRESFVLMVEFQSAITAAPSTNLAQSYLEPFSCDFIGLRMRAQPSIKLKSDMLSTSIGSCRFQRRRNSPGHVRLDLGCGALSPMGVRLLRRFIVWLRSSVLSFAAA